MAHCTLCAQYKNNYRNTANFEVANALPGDCDNDHSDTPADWITQEDIADLFADVSYVLAVAESTQTAVDMAAVEALDVVSLCCQGKYFISKKPIVLLMPICVTALKKQKSN